MLLFGCAVAQAHDARPVAVTLTETQPAIFQVLMRVPPSVEPDNQPELIWPATCEELQNPISGVRRCDANMEGQQFSLRYPQFNPSLATFYRLVPQTGSPATAMLAPSEAAWTVPAAMTPQRVIRDYTLLGIEHIIGGYDHLLFVFGLLVIARTPRRVLMTVTGFTVAHSISLSLSALGFVHVPIPPVEATIALSIVFLAYEISRQDQKSLTYRFPLLVSLSFGLLHGLGFASALGEIGLVENEALLSLLFFNVGVELGQVFFIATVAVLVALGSRLLRQHGRVSWSNATLRQRSDLLASYLIGVPAVYWLLERVAQY